MNFTNTSSFGRRPAAAEIQHRLRLVQAELRSITGKPIKDEADRLRRMTLWRELDALVRAIDEAAITTLVGQKVRMPTDCKCGADTAVIGATDGKYYVIRAVLIGSGRCEADGIIAYGYAPVLDLCRALIKAGHDPKRALHAYRGEVLALAVRSIGEGAQLTIEDGPHGTPRLRRWRNRPGRYGAGSPVAQTGNGQGVPTSEQKAIQRAVP
jgi:hypothetical protein